MSIVTSLSSLFRRQTPHQEVVLLPPRTDNRVPGRYSFFCTLPPDVIREIFEYLSDMDIQTVLLVCKSVNISVNYALDGRIRTKLNSILLAHGIFTAKSYTPLAELKREVRQCYRLEGIRARVTQMSIEADTRAREKDRKKAQFPNAEDHVAFAQCLSIATIPFTATSCIVAAVDPKVTNPILFK